MMFSGRCDLRAFFGDCSLKFRELFLGGVPNCKNVDLLGLTSVDDPVGAEDSFSDVGSIVLRDLASHFRQAGKEFHRFLEFCNESPCSLSIFGGHIGLYTFEVVLGVRRPDEPYSSIHWSIIASISS